MPRKSPQPRDTLRDDLVRLAEAAFLEARKKAVALRRKKAEVKKAQLRARNLRAMVAAITGKPHDGTGSTGFLRNHPVLHDEWPWRSALARRGMVPADYARQQVNPPLGVETAKSWLKASSTRRRPIPGYWADKIAAEFKDTKGRSEVPAVDSSWPHGIRRG